MPTIISSHIYMGEKIQICSRQPKNLLALAGGARDGPRGCPKPLLDAGCYKCNHCKVSCPILSETKKFKSSNTGKIYKIKQRVTLKPQARGEEKSWRAWPPLWGRGWVWVQQHIHDHNRTSGSKDPIGFRGKGAVLAASVASIH